MLPALALLAALDTAPSPAAPTPTPEPPTAQSFYSKAVEAMRELPQPQYVTYRMDGESDGLRIRLIVRRHLVWLEFQSGGGGGYGIEGYAPPYTSWNLRHRTDDYETEIVDNMYGRRLVSARAFFDPTWYGAFRALRDGMLFYQPPERPMSSFATPTPGPTPDLRTIAVVSVIGSGIYRAEDGGSTTCTNGDDGHAIRLIPKDRNRQHQLSDVVVDMRNMRFCSIRFNASDGTGFNGTVEEHFSEVGGYWLQTDGVISSKFKALGISIGNGAWRYHMIGMGFPPSIPGEAFVPPPWQ